MTNKSLQRMYQGFNKKWFSNKLPKNLPVRFYDIDDMGVTRCYWDYPSHIKIANRIRWSQSLVAMTLLHEMVHVEFPKLEHGPTFHKRMLQLAKAGAFKPWW